MTKVLGATLTVSLGLRSLTHEQLRLWGFTDLDQRLTASKGYPQNHPQGVKLHVEWRARQTWQLPSG